MSVLNNVTVNPDYEWPINQNVTLDQYSNKFQQFWSKPLNWDNAFVVSYFN